MRWVDRICVAALALCASVVAPLACDPVPTTPSAARRSPLVTQEGEGWQQPVLPAPPGSPAPRPGAVTDPGRPTPFTAAYGGQPTAASGGKRVAFGTVIGLGILALLGGAYALLAPKRQPNVETPSSNLVVAPTTRELQPPAPGKNASATERTTETPAVVAPDVGLVEEPSGLLAPSEESPPPSPERPPPEGEVLGAVEVNDSPAGEPTPPASGRPRTPRVTRQTQVPPAAIESARPAEARPDVTDQATAKLTLDTVPWTTVYLGKKRLGDTPLVDVVIPAGEVELLLVNPEFDIRQPYLVKAKAGARLRKKLKLD